MLLRNKKDLRFYDLLEAQANAAHRAAVVFNEMVGDFPNMATYVAKIGDIEHEGDDLTHDLQNLVAITFITPLDKEDLRDLSQSLDDVTDYVEAAAARAELYRLGDPRHELDELAKHLVVATELVEKSVAMLRDGFNRSSPMRRLLTEIHTVENASDKLFRNALRNLFDEPGIDALSVMKWKELFDRIETAIDKTEDIAAILGTIVDKYA